MTDASAFLLRVLLMTFLAIGNAQAQTVMMAGAGNSSCGTWTAARRNGLALEHGSWVLGYISGVAMAYLTAGRNDVDPLLGVDVNGVLAWMDNYCHVHPLVPIQKAAWEFIIEHQHG
jgi:hypothetical protein